MQGIKKQKMDGMEYMSQFSSVMFINIAIVIFMQLSKGWALLIPDEWINRTWL